MRKRKSSRNAFGILFFFVAVLCIVLIFIYRNEHQEEQTESVYISETVLNNTTYYELDQVLCADGYQRAEEADAVIYEKQKPEITITVDLDNHKIWKNQYCFDITSDLVSKDEVLYLNNALVSEVLNGTVQNHTFCENVLAEDAWLKAAPPLFAHALGGVVTEEKTYTYTNSMDALVENYNKGFRMFEMDFMLSTDGTLLGLHSFKMFGGQAISSVKWKNSKVEERFQTMNLDDIYLEMTINKDMYLITDTKSYEYSDDCIQQIYDLLYEKAMAYGGEELLKRVIPQIYSQKEYALVKQVYDWPALIYTLYREDDIPDDDILEFVKGKKDIPLVTVPKRRVAAEFSAKLHQAGKLVYTHTIDDINSIPDWREKGADGFYTNNMTIAEFSEKYGEEKRTIQKIELKQ